MSGFAGATFTPMVGMMFHVEQSEGSLFLLSDHCSTWNISLSRTLEVSQNKQEQLEFSTVESLQTG